MSTVWITHPTHPEIAVRLLPEGGPAANSYMLVTPQGAWLFDPAHAPEAWGAEAGYVVGLFATHGHADHIAAATDWRTWKQIPLSAHKEISTYLSDAGYNVSAWYGVPQTFAPVDTPLTVLPGEVIHVPLTETIDLEVRHFPGHTFADVTYLIRVDQEPFALVTGDVVFADSIGRNDLPGSSPEDQATSLQSLGAVLRALPRAVPVGPGHGRTTTVGDLLDGNPFLIGRYGL